MPSFLETLPREVLQHIALLTTPSPTESPTTAIRTLQTSSNIRDKLHSPPSDFHLYASIFRCKFDTAAIRRRQGTLPCNSVLAAELVQRYSVLQRIRARQILPETIHRDLATILHLIVESDGLNEWHLRRAGVVAFVLQVSENLTTLTDEVRALALLVLSLSLSREYITSQSSEWITTILSRVHPFTQSALVSHSQCFGNSSPTCILPGWASTSISPPSIKHQSSSAILLVLALEEAKPMHFPEHIFQQHTLNPLIRPNLVDLEAFARLRSPLVADNLDSIGFLASPIDEPDITYCSPGQRSVDTRSRSHDREFFRIGANSRPGAGYAPDVISGLWEGSWAYYTCPADESAFESSSFRAFESWNPLQLLLTQKSISVKRVSAATVANSDSMDQSSISKFQGETLPDHGEAWGYRRCEGEVRLIDGLVTFRMQRMHFDDSTWTFEAFIHNDRVLVGRCWAGQSLQASGARGIFSLTRISGASEVGGGIL